MLLVLHKQNLNTYLSVMMAGLGPKSMHNGKDYNSGNKLPCIDSNFMMNASKVLKFLKSETD
jgi:hypothetical protein